MRVMLAVLVAALGAVVVGVGAGGQPALRPVDADPLTLRGTSFARGERVKVLLAAPATVRSKTVRADARGRFRVAFAIRVGRCDDVVVQAIGARGSRAAWQRDALHCTDP